MISVGGSNRRLLGYSDCGLTSSFLFVDLSNSTHDITFFNHPSSSSEAFCILRVSFFLSVVNSRSNMTK